MCTRSMPKEFQLFHYSCLHTCVSSLAITQYGRPYASLQFCSTVCKMAFTRISEILVPSAKIIWRFVFLVIVHFLEIGQVRCSTNLRRNHARFAFWWHTRWKYLGRGHQLLKSEPKILNLIQPSLLPKRERISNLTPVANLDVILMKGWTPVGAHQFKN